MRKMKEVPQLNSELALGQRQIALSYSRPPRTPSALKTLRLLRDQDKIYGEACRDVLAAMGIKEIRTAPPTSPAADLEEGDRDS